MPDSSLTFIFFRLINFAVLMAVGYYAYRKYIKASLEEKINQKEAVLKGLEEQGYFLEGRGLDLEDQSAQQERHAALLKQKVDEWHDAVHAQRHKEQEENKIFAARSAERIHIKNAFIASHELKMHITPLVMHNAKEALRKQFADKAHNEKYVHDVVNILKAGNNHE